MLSVDESDTVGVRVGVGVDVSEIGGVSVAVGVKVVVMLAAMDTDGESESVAVSDGVEDCANTTGTATSTRNANASGCRPCCRELPPGCLFRAQIIAAELLLQDICACKAVARQAAASTRGNKGSRAVVRSGITQQLDSALRLAGEPPQIF